MNESERIERRISLHDMRVLMSVVQAGSMGKAAQRLATSQPAISRAIADLEHTLGVRLLDRTKLGIEPTAYGAALAERGIAVFDELRRAVQHIEFLADPTSGELHIAATLPIATGFGATVIDQMSRRYPRVVIHLSSGPSDMAYRALAERRVDLVIARLFAPIGKENVTVDILFDEQEVIVAGANNPLSKRRKLRLSELVDQPWVLAPEDSLSGTVFVEAFRAARLEPPRASVVASAAPARLAMVANRRFLTIVPKSMLTHSFFHAALKRLPVDLSVTRRPIAITTLKNRTGSPAAKLFIDLAREAAKTIGKLR
ncbi:MAG: LysR family transcriptional regulator [Xanthobacteraceae bacterium]